MKVAIVTGGSKGLGKEISLLLSKSGYRVYAMSRNPETVKGFISIKADVTKEKECKLAIDKILKTEKRIDLLINNAGINEPDVEKTFGVNFFGPFYLIKHAHEALLKNGGKVINITSLNGLVPTPGAAVYSASKHALEGCGIALSYELEKDGVFVTNVSPGAIHNPHGKELGHKNLREKFFLLKILFPMLTKEKVATEVLKIVKKDCPQKRVVLGVDAKLSFLVYRTFPVLWHFIVRKLYS